MDPDVRREYEDSYLRECNRHFSLYSARNAPADRSYIARVGDMEPSLSAAKIRFELHETVMTGRTQTLAIAPDIAVFEPIFAQLHDRLACLDQLNPDPDTYANAARFCSSMSQYYLTDDSRIASVQSLLHRLLGVTPDNSSSVISFHKSEHISGATPDYRAAVQNKQRLLVFFIERDKNELGVGGNPVAEATLDYAKMTLHREVC